MFTTREPGMEWFIFLLIYSRAKNAHVRSAKHIDPASYNHDATLVTRYCIPHFHYSFTLSKQYSARYPDFTFATSHNTFLKGLWSVTNSKTFTIGTLPLTKWDMNRLHYPNTDNFRQHMHNFSVNNVYKFPAESLNSLLGGPL